MEVSHARTGRVTIQSEVSDCGGPCFLGGSFPFQSVSIRTSFLVSSVWQAWVLFFFCLGELLLVCSAPFWQRLARGFGQEVL